MHYTNHLIGFVFFFASDDFFLLDGRRRHVGGVSEYRCEKSSAPEPFNTFKYRCGAFFGRSTSVAFALPSCTTSYRSTGITGTLGSQLTTQDSLSLE